MPRRLFNIKVREISLVDSPANPGAQVLLYKREGEADKAKWNTAYINSLLDSSFAVVESGGKKDADGKTTPRSLRHLPYKDASGKVDLPHLRNALARLDATKISADLKDKARTKLEAAAKDAGVGGEKKNMRKVAMVCPNCDDTLPIEYDDGQMEMPNYCPECGAKLDLTATGGDTTTQKKETKKMAEFKKEDLSPEAKAYVEGVEKQLADSQEALKAAKEQAVEKKDEPVDIWKGVHPDVKKQFEEMQARTVEAETLAKSEQEKRETAEFTKRAETEFSHLAGADHVTKGRLLRAIHQKLTKEDAQALETILKSAEEVIKAGKVFDEIGTSGAGDGTSAWERIEKLAQERVSKGLSKTKEAAVDAVLTDPEHAELYKQYKDEHPGRARRN